MDQSEKVVEDFTSTTIVVTAVISSLIAIALVLVLILAAFLVRNRFLPHQDKMPPPGSHQQDSMHYATFNSFGGPGAGTDYGYASPAVILAHRDSSKPNISKKTAGDEERNSLSREYEQPSFSSFIGSNGNVTGNSSNNGTSKSKKTEYYSSAPVPNPMLHVIEGKNHEHFSGIILSRKALSNGFKHSCD
jgi:hypothetical protein